MNNIKTIENSRIVGGDYFKFTYLRSSKLYLKDFIHKFNFNDYWCLKATGSQRLISEEEFLDFKYSGYIFFRKDLYDIDKILEWVNYFNNIGGVKYVTKPTPPFSPTKIKIMK